MTSEYNYDIAERSFYFDPSAHALGAFSPRFMGQVAAELQKTMQMGGARVSRLE